MKVEKIPRRMMRWRKRFEAEDGDGGWVGVSIIANAVGLPKKLVKSYLEEWEQKGLIEKITCSNGVFWRGILDNKKIDLFEKELAV